ncbi:hypothetical protein KA005_38915 [bacterium]|nr:hypothetical protein [bacterium]
MIPLSGRLKDDLEKKYGKRQNLPIIEQKKPVLSDCYSCERFEQGPDLRGNVRKINWCVTKYFDRIKKRPMIHYANIELLECCPKMVKKR